MVDRSLARTLALGDSLVRFHTGTNCMCVNKGLVPSLNRQPVQFTEYWGDIDHI